MSHRHSHVSLTTPAWTRCYNAKRLTVIVDIGKSSSRKPPGHAGAKVNTAASAPWRSGVVKQLSARFQNPQQIRVEGIRVQFTGDAQGGWVVVDDIECCVAEIRDDLCRIAMDQCDLSVLKERL